MLRLCKFFAVLAFVTGSARAVVHDVSVSGVSFTPNVLLINSGDSVRWTNNGGFHNVAHIGVPVQFRSGDPSSDNWVFIHRFMDTEITSYLYVCEVHASQGMAGSVTVNVTSAADEPAIPVDFSVGEVYPNPFNAVARLDLFLPSSSTVKIDVFNSLGRHVDALFDGFAVAGRHVIALDGSNWTSGLYFIRVSALGQDTFKKIVLLK